MIAPRQHAELPPCLWVPEPEGPVVARGDYETRVRAERAGVHRARVTFKGAHQLAVSCVQHLDGVARSVGEGQEIAIGAEGACGTDAGPDPPPPGPSRPRPELG